MSVIFGPFSSRFLIISAVSFSLAALAEAQSVRTPSVYNAGGVVYASPAVGTDGVIYIGVSDIDSTDGLNDNRILALYPNLTLKAEYLDPAWEQSSWPDSSLVTAADGSLYSCNLNGYVYRLEWSGGILVKTWSFQTAGTIIATPALGANGILYVAGEDGLLYALDPSLPETSNPVWFYDFGVPLESSPAIGPDGTIYVCAKTAYDTGNALYEATVTALSATGTLRWTFRHLALKNGDSSRIKSSPAVSTNGTVYVGIGESIKVNGTTTTVNSGTLLAIDANGLELWEAGFTDKVDSSPVIGPSGEIYVGTRDGFLTAVGADGSLLWFYDVGDVFYSSPVVGSDGTVCIAGYVGNNQTRLWGFNPASFANGSPLPSWTAALNRITSGVNNLVDSSPTVHNGKLYIGSYNGYLYAVDFDTGLAATPWPKYHRSIDNQGRVFGAGDYFPGTQYLPNGWSWVEWLGYYYGGYFPWIFTSGHNWWYGSGTGGSAFWLYDQSLSWVWTSPATYPLFYGTSSQPNLGGWLLYTVESANPRQFWSYTANDTITVP